MEVIGFEGLLRPEHDITWGCAAVRDGDKIFNACTGAELNPEEWAEFVEERVVTPLDTPIPMAADWDWDGAIVFGLRFDDNGKLRAPGAELFKPTRARGVLSQQGWIAYAYDNREASLEDILDYRKALIDTFDAMLKTGLVFHVHALDLNVIRTAIECLPGRRDDERMDFRQQLGDAILRSEADHAAFKQIFGLTSE